METNTNYWNLFYNNKSNLDKLTNNSNFSKFVNLNLKEHQKIVDIGCGNGKDSLFFEKQNHQVIGIDNSIINDYLGKDIIKMSALDLDLDADVYYCRFFIHSLTEDECDMFLLNLKKLLDRNKGSRCFIETRSCKEYKKETNFISSIGDSHFRMLYSLEYLKNKLDNLFCVSYIEESNLFAPFLNETPFCIRTIITSK